jgi:hypothetical protein
MSDDNQIIVPPSFLAVHSDTRGRLTLPKDELRLRYELCEDLAQHLSEQAKTLEHDMGLSQDLVLQRMHAGLSAAVSSLSAQEAGWVVHRIAELAGWPNYPDDQA